MLYTTILFQVLALEESGYEPAQQSLSQITKHFAVMAGLLRARSRSPFKPAHDECVLEGPCLCRVHYKYQRMYAELRQTEHELDNAKWTITCQEALTAAMQQLLAEKESEIQMLRKRQRKLLEMD